MSATTSTVGWIVGTLAEREEILALLQDDGVHEPRDELGMASLRDVMSEAFFPGVTTIQTRAKYFLFVPAMYDRIENDRRLRSRPEASIKELEEELLAGLLMRHANDSQRGIIGERFKRPPQNPSSGIYWRGLSTWTIRRFHNTRGQYHAWLRQPARSLQWREIEEGVEETQTRWRSRNFGDDVLVNPTLELQPDEAQFLQECVLRLPAKPDRSLMTDLLREDVSGCSQLWETEAVTSGDAAVAQLALDAERVSAAVHGAMLLYNLLCARRFAPAAVEFWDDSLEGWRAQHPAKGWVDWDLAGFWAQVEHLPFGVNAHRRTASFLSRWADVLRRENVTLAALKQAEELLVRREQRTKPGRERLSGRCSQQNWTAAGVGAEPLSFRWPRAKQMLIDMSVA